MRVVVTGGNGFLGAALCRHLARRGDEVTAADIDVEPGGSLFQHVRVDIADLGAFARLVETTAPDAIVHLASLLTDTSEADPVAATRVNCLGSAVVLDCAGRMGIPRLVLAGSVAAGSDTAPGSIYGLTKQYAERLATLWADLNPQLHVTIARLGWVYGIGRTRGWGPLQQVILDAATGRQNVRCPAYTSPIDWTYVDDATDALTVCLDRAPGRGERIDVAGDLRPVGDAVAHLQMRYPKVRFDLYPSTPPPSHWVLDPSPLHRLNGGKPATRLEDGLDRMIAVLQAAASNSERT